jgi:uncharacterized protein
MRKHLRKHLPDHESIRSNRWLAVFGNILIHPRLWHLNRHSAAGALAVGLFCAMIPGPFQMLAAALLAVMFKVNLPLALLGTLFSNPLTIVPLYVFAFHIGEAIVGHTVDFVAPPAFEWPNVGPWIEASIDWMFGLGEPLAVGVPILAALLGLAGYGIVWIAWRVYILHAWHRRHQRKHQP